MSLLARLDPYSSSALPPGARTDPSLVQRQGRPFLRGWGIRDVVQLTKLVAHKTNHLASELIVHGLYGPRKPSWGVEMTLITSFLRDAGKHSSLADIAFIRAMTSLSAYLPSTGPGEHPPQVTPLSFVVRSRGLRGLLEPFDRAELGGADFRQRRPPAAVATACDDRPARQHADGLPPMTRDESGNKEATSGLENESPRWLAGEWVVDKTLWKAWQADWRRQTASSGSVVAIARATGAAAATGTGPTGSSSRSSSSSSRYSDNSSRPSRSSTPSRTPQQQRPRVILYLHGGAYYAFSASTHRSLTARLSASTESRVFALNYRLSPETRFPGPLHDAVAAYLRLREEEHVGEEGGPEILVAGDSAGGGLCLGLLLYLRDNGYPLPSGAILMSPWVDLTLSCDSWDSNAPFDIVPIPEPGDHLNPVLCYLGPEGAKKYLTHPYASPLFGDFTGLPPLLIQSGEAEVLRDEITLLAHKASLQGVHVMHEVYDEMVHVFQSLSFLPAAKIALASQRDFVLRALPAFRAEAAAAIAASGDEDIVSTLTNSDPSEGWATTAAVGDGNDTSRDLVASSAASPDDRPRQQPRRPSMSLRRSSSATAAAATAPPAVPPVPPQFKRTRSAVKGGISCTSSSSNDRRRPALTSYRSHPAQPSIDRIQRVPLSPSTTISRQQASSLRLQKSASGPGLGNVAGVPSSVQQKQQLASSALAVPPTPPKGRNRSLTNPEVWALIRDFEADAYAGSVSNGGTGTGGNGIGTGSYTVRRFAAAPETAAAAAAAAAAVVRAANESA